MAPTRSAANTAVRPEERRRSDCGRNMNGTGSGDTDEEGQGVEMMVAVRAQNKRRLVCLIGTPMCVVAGVVFAVVVYVTVVDSVESK